MQFQLQDAPAPHAPFHGCEHGRFRMSGLTIPILAPPVSLEQCRVIRDELLTLSRLDDRAAAEWAWIYGQRLCAALLRTESLRDETPDVRDLAYALCTSSSHLMIYPHVDQRPCAYHIARARATLAVLSNVEEGK